jgi:DNA-binding transcriptional ArsR family regulator
MVHLMHEMMRSKPPGFLPQNPLETPLETLGKLMSFSPQTIRKHLAILQRFGVIKQHECGRWYSERMYRDWLKYRKSQEDGAKGGNPELVGDGLTRGVKGGGSQGVNPNKNKNKKRIYIKEGESDFSDSPLYEKGQEPYDLALFLADLIQSNNERAKTPDLLSPAGQKWCKVFDLMIRRDGLEPAEIAAVIRWCQSDDFWQTNILSPAKFRKQYARLYAEAKKANAPLRLRKE